MIPWIGRQYRVHVWEDEHGWQWRVVIYVANGRAWRGVSESRTVAFRMVAEHLSVIEQVEESEALDGNHGGRKPAHHPNPEAEVSS